MSERDLPLFPLRVVLFPGMSLPLHVFEERYKEMMRRCLSGDRTFGVVLIKEGREVGGPALPCQVGTTALVETVEQLPEGRMNLVAVGRQRFRILELTQHEPYLVGRVALLAEEPAQAAPELVARVIERYRAYQGVLHSLGHPATDRLPDDPSRLSFQLAAALRVDPPVRQQLLEAPSTAERLERELVLLRRGLDVLRLLATAPKHAGSAEPFSRN